MTRSTVAILAAVLALIACGKKPDAPEKPGEPQALATAPRAETRGIRSTEALGYAGDAIAAKTDAALDANDRRKDALDAAIDGQTKPE